MESVSLVFYLMAFVGVLFLFASISSWPWFFKQRRPQIFIEKFGMKGARFFYGFLGLLFLITGYLVIIDVLKFRF